MTHTELVQVATDLLFASPNSEKWLPSYDAALASETDSKLADLVAQLQQEQGQSHHRMAA